MVLDDSERLRHMLAWSQSAIRLATGNTRDDLETNEMLVLALIRCIEVVGEAAARMTQSRQASLPQIPWGVSLA